MSTTGAIVPSGPSRLWGWVRGQTQSLSGMRDLILVAAGACYGVGYLVWSIHAWHRNLGLLPALKFQYLIAGAIPVLFVLVVCGLLWGLFRLRDRVADWLEPREGVKRFVPMAFIFLICLSGAVFAIGTQPWAGTPSMDRLTGLDIASGATMVVLMILLPPPGKKAAPRYRPRSTGAIFEVAFLTGIRRFAAPYSVLLGVFGALAGVLWFIVEAYPRIPQELGGVHPRRAVIYLSAESRVAPEIHVALRRDEGDEQPDSGERALHEGEEAVRESDEAEAEVPIPGVEIAGGPPTEVPSGAEAASAFVVDVYFADSNMLLVKPIREDRTFQSPTYEIRRQSIAAISWQ